VFHIENEYDPDQGDYPSNRQIAKTGSGLFWNLMSDLPGNKPQHYEPVDPQLARMRASVEHYAKLNAVARGEAPATGIVEKVIEAVRAVVRPPAKLSLAVEWLAEVLQHGPVPQVDVETRGRDAGFTLKMLKEAKGKLKAISSRKGRNYWVWQLPVAVVPKEGQR
jgi:hypothetical protein